MKKSNKINENPNAVYSEEYDVAIPWTSIRTMCFSYYGEKMYIGSGKMTHLNLYAEYPGIDERAEDNLGRGKYAGRLFVNLRIISFWDFPPNKSEFDKTIADIEKMVNTKFTDDWKVEVPSKRTLEKKDNFGWGSWYPKKTDQEFIPIREYAGGYERNPDEMRMQHVMSPLKKSETNNSMKGSYKTAWDSKDNIESRQKRMTSESEER
jgi:hypothetical protein